MNLMGYDAMALGPKELSLGPALLRERIDEANFPILSANALWRDSRQLVAEPYVILTIGGHRIAVLGLTRLPDEELDGIDVAEPKEAVSFFVVEAANLADTLVLLTNLPLPSAIELAQDLEDLDLLVAALPGQLPQQAIRLSSGALAIVAEQPLARHVGRRVGRLVVWLESSGSFSSESWSSVPMGSDIADDLEMAVLLDGYR